MPSPIFVPTSTQGILRGIDGTASPLIHTAAFDRGDFKLSNIRRVMNTPVKVMRRGRQVGYGLGDREFASGSFSCWAPKLTNAADGSIGDMVAGTGLYAARVSTLSATALANTIPLTLDLHWHWEGSDQGGTDSDLYLEDCDVKIDSIEEGLEGNFISFSFEVWGAGWLSNTASGTKYFDQVA